jgi:hypothetical protein
MIWKVSDIYVADSLDSVAKKLTKYDLDLMRMKKVRYGRVEVEPVDDLKDFPLEMGILNLCRLSRT